MKWSDLSERDRDALIAEKIMGWQYVPYTAYIGGPPEEAKKLAIERGWYTWQNELGVDENILADFTADMNAAMTVVEKWPQRVSMWKTAGPDLLPWCCAFYTNDSRYRVLGYGVTLPEAICHAACLALGVIDED